MVNIQIASSCPGRSIVRANPGSTSSGTSTTLHDTSTVALQNCFSRVALAGDGNPVREKVLRVAILRPLGSNSKSHEFRLGGGDCGNAGWGRSGERKLRAKDKSCEEDKALHLCGEYR